MPDIDIDLPSRETLLNIIEHVPACIVDQSGTKRHNTGIYCQAIPVNPLTGTASIDYKTAESRGYCKIDLLNVNIYKDVKNEKHLAQLMETEPLWELLEEDQFVNMLFQLSGHGSILRIMKPKSVEQLAAVLAMIRPAKRHLIGMSWPAVLTEVWEKPANGDYYWKKSHAFAYAVAVIVQMNLICQQMVEQ